MRRLAAVLLVAALATGGCSGGDEPKADPTPSATPTPTPPPTAAPPPPAPKRLECRRIDFDAALAPTGDQKVVACKTLHTAQTYAVGELSTEVAGHLLAVDSDRVQQQVASACPKKLAGFLGTTDDALRLTMLRAVWFTPSVEESDAGANWYRCDALAVAGDDRLAKVRGSLENALKDDAGKDSYGMCGTAAPDNAAFKRVLCRESHSWRAIQVVELAGKKYPGENKVRAAGQGPCEDAGRAVADDALDYEWGYEWPTADQWATGQHYGRCWAPEPASTP